MLVLLLIDCIVSNPLEPIFKEFEFKTIMLPHISIVPLLAKIFVSPVFAVISTLLVATITISDADDKIF